MVIIETSQCDHGKVRVVPVNETLNFGRVEVCIGSHWGTVCRDGWDDDDAAVVCNQFGYGRDGNLIHIAAISRCNRLSIFFSRCTCIVDSKLE